MRKEAQNGTASRASGLGSRDAGAFGAAGVRKARAGVARLGGNLQTRLDAFGDFSVADVARAGAEPDAARMRCGVRAFAEASAGGRRAKDRRSIGKEQKERAAEKASEQRAGDDSRDGRDASERAERHRAIVGWVGQKNR